MEEHRRFREIVLEKQIIKGIKYCTLSEEDVKNISEVYVSRALDYDCSGETPIMGGLYDPHMGPANDTLICLTCYGNFRKCQGHYGYLHLVEPVYHVGYLTMVEGILKCICKECSRILLNNDICTNYLKKMKGDSEDRGLPWDELKKIQFVKDLIEKCSKVKTCPYCEYNNGTIKKDPNGRSFLYHNDTILYPDMALFLLKEMVDEDRELLCVSEKPEKLFILTISVPPLAVRPSLPLNLRLAREDYLTERLKKIIKANEILTKHVKEYVIKQRDLDSPIYKFEVDQYMNSDDQQGQPLPAGLVQRLRGKQGRIRGTLSRKNVNYSGRTVISPDPYLKITEAAIPIPMACHLTYPERVTPRNRQKLQQRVRNGADMYPGAILVRKRTVSMLWNLMPPSWTVARDLEVGDIVDRHLEDGDIVLLNGQPSLNRMSMMCHRARILPGRTLRLNASVCDAYNVYFDGDEMNIHVPQTEEARAEAISLMAVSSESLLENCIGCNNLWTPKNGEILVAVNQDSVPAKCFLSYNVSSESLPKNCIGGNNLCTTKNGEILVALNQDLLTSFFLITRKDTFYDRSEFSHILSYIGHMDTELPEAAIKKPVELWSGKQLFSILLCSHENVNLTVREKFYCTKHDDRNREKKTMCPNDGFVYFHNSELISGQLGKATLGNGNKDGLFFVILNDYNAYAAACCINRLSKLSAQWIGNHGFSIAIHDVEPQNTLINAKDDMISNGYQTCKESMEIFYGIRQDDNAGRIAAQNLETKITDELNDIRGALGEVCMETLHWRNSLLIMSQSGSKGSPINISQMVASVGQQLVGGCRAAIGFTDRSLPHFPKQARSPAAKGFVANSFYNGLSATEFFFHAMEVREGVPISENIEDTGLVTRRLMKALEDLFSHYDCTVRNTGGDIVQFCYGDDGMDPVSMEGKNGKPLNFERLFLRSKAMCPKDGDEAALSSSDLCEVVRQELSELCMSNLVESGFSEDLKNFICGMSGITRRQIEVFVNTCVSRYRSKLIDAGTPVGAIAALSIGEPVSQMTLETFHFAGDATIISTCGAARIKEITSGQRRISTPIITTILERDNNENIAEEVKHCIEGKISVRGIKTVKRVVICKDPKVDKFMVLLEGTGLRWVMSLEGVNARKTVSNHVIEVYDILGIEAARNCIIDQIKLTMRNQGMRIDMRHIMLLADEMTASGMVLGTTITGFEKRCKSVLTLASIDRAPEYLFDACVHERDDPVEGVTDCIIMGRPIQIGTGMVKVLPRPVLGPSQLPEGPINRVMDDF
ncbi:unnamed protein product [Trifolium pratense]|uniref:Uncharacterized protein n=1 Tax=Trifolium pratense TaxID=57577 RepID=A0ACB0KJ91_TRIPR|nr:unnamed protein product [Trifolium pratense]